MAFTLSKPERLNRKKIIEKMFKGGSPSFSIFPLRVVYCDDDTLEVPCAILISVSKRHFKRAVKRNRVKRQIREAYRLHKADLARKLVLKNRKIAVAFIYLSDNLVDSAYLESRVCLALKRLEESL